MKPSVLRWLFLAVVATFFIGASVAEPETLGVTAAWINGSYAFEGGTAPWALGFALVTIGLYLVLMHSSSTAEGQPLPGLSRRFVAFWFDFWLAMITLVPTAGILPMLTEWRRTGIFQWNFERATQAPGDGAVGAVGMALFLAGLTGYYALPLVRGKPSPRKLHFGLSDHS